MAEAAEAARANLLIFLVSVPLCTQSPEDRDVRGDSGESFGEVVALLWSDPVRNV